MMLSSKGLTKALTATFGGIVTMLSATVASAQTPAATTAPTAAPAAPAPAEPASASVSVGATATPTEATATATAEPPVPPPEPEPIPAPVEPVTTEEVAPAEAAPAEEAPKGTPKLLVFGDAWAGFQSAKSGSPSGGDVYATKGPDGSAQSGFGLSWLGADIGYDAGAWAVNGSLRFGDAVAQYGTGTLGPITNAYLTWRPVDGLSLVAGTFGTIYGAEVAESWLNLNYTRGELYMNMQPFWHTGIKAEFAKDAFVARALVVNEPNNSTLNDGAVNLGGQVGYVSDVFSAYGGVLQSLRPETSMLYGSIFATFVDVVAIAKVKDLTLIGNFDFNGGYKSVVSYWGGSLAAGYAFTEQFGLAVRGEHLKYDNEAESSLTTGTLTLDIKPVKDSQNFVVRLDGRVESASDPIYNKPSGEELSETWFSSTLGVVGYADLL
jgi:hypothetical protein